MSRPLILVLLLAAAVLGPMFLFDENKSAGLQNPQTVTAINQAAYPVTSGSPFQLPAANTTVHSIYSNASYPAATSPAVLPSTTPNSLPNAQPIPQMRPNGGAALPSLPFGQALPNANGTGMSVPGMALPPMTQVGPVETTFYSGNQFGPNIPAGPMEFPPVTNLAEVFRFDTNPQWVRQRWSRVSTSPGEYDLQGLRVPLVTGTNPWDLHGSLTYYFDGNQVLQRIQFQGWTGDPEQLLKLLESKYGFKQKASRSAGLYVAGRGFPRSGSTGALLLKHPSVIRAENPVQQLAMVLEINNPKGKGTLSQAVQRMVVADRVER